MTMIAQIHTPSKHGFPETADIDTASDDYAGRFAGPAGARMLEVQERITLRFVARSGARTILDVGGGHGQLAAPLCRAGYDVTVLGSDERCRGRIAGIVDSGKCKFVVGNAIALPFPDRSFDMAISFRFLTHCARWPDLVGELCRVSRGGVIVDYPTSQSVNVIAPGLFRLKKKVETNTRAWTLFRHAAVLREFERRGFRKRARKAQFFLPMVLHRMLKSRGLSAALEGACRMLGLTALAGSPIILWMERNDLETPRA